MACMGLVGEYPGDNKLSAGEVEYERSHDHRMATWRTRMYGKVPNGMG